MKLIVTTYLILLISFPLVASDYNIYSEIDRNLITNENQLDSIHWKNSNSKILQRCIYSYAPDTILQLWYDSTNKYLGTQINVLNSSKLPIFSYNIDSSFTRYYYEASNLDSICLLLSPQSMSCFSKTTISRNIVESIDTVNEITIGIKVKHINKLNEKGDVVFRETYYDTTKLTINSINYNYQDELVFDTCKEGDGRLAYVSVYSFYNKRIFTKKTYSLTGNPLYGGLGFADVFYFYRTNLAIRSTNKFTAILPKNKIDMFYSLNGRLISNVLTRGSACQLLLIKETNENQRKAFWLGSNTTLRLP